MIDTVVIPAAGLGTRLFTITKESPKEMVPVFYKTKNNIILLKPLLEIIFENLYDSGFRNFCFIVGRGKETIENQEQELSPEQIAALKANMTEYYNDQIPMLKLQLEAEGLAADLEEARLRRLVASMRIAQIMAGPQADPEAKQSQEELAEFKKERKLKTQA